jgi:hypothetical protein
MNMLEEHERPSNQRSEEEGMNMAGIHMVEVEGMNMVEERPSKERPKVEGMDIVEKRPMKQRPNVEGMDMVEDMMAKVDVGVVEREHGVDKALDRQLSEEASMNSSGTGACEVRVLRMSHHVCKSILQLFSIA